MSDRQERQQVAAAAERLSGLVLDGVVETLAQRSSDPGRHYVGMITGGGDSEEDRATELMVTLILVRWLSVAREQIVEPDPVDAVLDWIRDALGPRYAARARYTSGPLLSEDNAADIMQYRAALGGDFLPSLMWQLAAVVDLYGKGDIEWLRSLVGAPERAG